MEAQGVIAESIIGFKITWESMGRGQQPKWDQNNQSIEIHETDVYPDLEYTSAYAAPKYVRYTSGAQLNELLMKINAIIDEKLAGGQKNEAALPPGPPANKALPGPEKKKELMSGGEVAHALTLAPVREGDLVTTDKPNQLDNIDTNQAGPNEPDVTTNAPAKAEGSNKDLKYTVIVHGDKLRFIEGQQEKGAYASGIKFLYMVSNNLIKNVAGDKLNNTDKIWAEVIMNGVSHKFKFEEFTVKTDELILGGNLLAQVLPSIELAFTPDPNSVYTKEKPELDLADVIKATSITLGTRTVPEIKAIQTQIQKELEARESGKRTVNQDKESLSAPNK